MKIYHWVSHALKQYSLGDIVVCASSVDEARDIARREFPAYAQDYWSWLFIEGCDDTEDRDAKFAQFEADIAKEPTVADAVFIQGGE